MHIFSVQQCVFYVEQVIMFEMLSNCKVEFIVKLIFCQKCDFCVLLQWVCCLTERGRGYLPNSEDQGKPGHEDRLQVCKHISCLNLKHEPHQ